MVLHSCLMSRYRWEGRCLRLNTSTFKPCHIIWQLGSRLNSVNDVKTVFLEPTSGLAQVKWEEGIRMIMTQTIT